MRHGWRFCLPWHGSATQAGPFLRQASLCLILGGLGASALALPVNVSANLPEAMLQAPRVVMVGETARAGGMGRRNPADFPWPVGVRWQQVLHGVRWQGCPLDAVLFTSAEAPGALARRLSLALQTRPALLLEPDTLRLHWYETGRHWVLGLAAAEGGGTAGSLSVLTLQECGRRKGQADGAVPSLAGAVPAAPAAIDTNVWAAGNVLLESADTDAGHYVNQRLTLHHESPLAVWQAWTYQLAAEGWVSIGDGGAPAVAPDTAVAVAMAAAATGAGHPRAQVTAWHPDGRRLQLSILSSAQGTAVWRLDERTEP